ncbi:cyclin-dependent kinase 4 inhibitor B [Lepisosteus oculatus]|uniref:cyclin-dependent kinase 4 inhibitor B n=1 Tax=Lepisosteus oculatus TaxID=7918 RepID=UPI0035F517EE
MSSGDILSSAAATGNIILVEQLLKAGIDPNDVNAFSRTPLQVMMMGNPIVAELLLSHGADPNVSDCSTFSTPLHDAAREGFLCTVKVLVQYNADRNVKDNNSRLPIDLARENGHGDVVAFLEL